MNSQPLLMKGFDTLPTPSRHELLISVINQARPKEWYKDYPNIQDLHELLVLENIRKRTLVWLDEKGKIYAFSFVDPFNNLIFECLDNTIFNELFSEAVKFACAAFHKKSKKEDVIPSLDASCRGEDLQRIHCLQAEGFKRDGFDTVFLQHTLNDFLSPPIIPEGFVIRPLAGEQELDEYVNLHQAVFGTDLMTKEIRKSIMSSPEYDPQLDLVVQTRDGRLAAFCVCQINPYENEISEQAAGWTDPIGVHPDFRRIGLAKALIQEGLIQLKTRGMEFAKLGTRSDNFAMLGLAKQTGFCVVSRRLWFSKKV
jgi:mycothiol synthase